MTLQQLKKFIKTRNASAYQSNLQFQFDADACRFKISELGDAKKIVTPGGITGYEWQTPHGKLREFMGKMFLEGTPEWHDVAVSQCEA